MDKPFVLKVYKHPDDLREISRYTTIKCAETEAERLYDGGMEDDFYIFDSDTGETLAYPAYGLCKVTCPVCGKEIRHSDMRTTRDCHGIPYRLVCLDCFFDIMDGPNGYDGEYYDETDECLDEYY